MNDYIDREAALNEIKDILKKARKSIRKIPATDLVPVRIGRWENAVAKYEKVTTIYMQCSMCNCYHNEIYCGKDTKMPRFCPNCGADMREES